MLDVTCPSSNGGLYQCRESFPVPVADTMGFRLLGGLVRNFCDSVKITSQDSFNTGKGCIGDTMILYRIYKIKDSRDSVLCRILYQAVDSQAPMISCPANVTISCAADTSALIRGFTTATDNCEPTNGIKIMRRDSIVSGACANEKFIYRIWTATDSCGNASNCTQLITTIDTIAPIVECRDTNFVYSGDHYVVVYPDLFIKNLSDNCSDHFIKSIDHDTIFCNRGLYLDTIQVFVEDECGNIGTCSSIVELIDITPPSITCPPDLTISLNSCECFADLTEDGMVTIADLINFTDNCDTALTYIQLMPTQFGIDSIPVGVHEFTFAGIDDFGNADTCSFLVTVLGSQGEEIICNSNIHFSLDENCQGIVYPSLTVLNKNCSDDAYTVLLFDEHNIPIPNQILTREYIGTKITAKTYYRCSPNYCWTTVLVEDKLAPKLVCRIDSLYCFEDSLIMPDVIEACGVAKINVIDVIYESIMCDENVLGKKKVKYQAVDSYGNKSEICESEIYFKRIPFDSIGAPDFQSLTCSQKYKKDAQGNPDPSVTGYPKFGEFLLKPGMSLTCNIFVNYTDLDLITSDCKKKIWRLWNIREWNCGKEITKTLNQFIEIIDNEAPVFTSSLSALFDLETANNCEAIFYLPKLDVVDNCSQISQICYSINGFTDIYHEGKQVRIPLGNQILAYIVSDACGNQSTFTSQIRVIDKTAPTVVCDANTVVSLNTDGEAWLNANSIASDSYDNCSTITIRGRRMENSPCLVDSMQWLDKIYFCCEDIGKTIMVAIRVTDQSGNQNICMVNVEVQSKAQFAVVCLPDVIVDCSAHQFKNELSVYGKFVQKDTDRKFIEIDSSLHPIFIGQAIDGLVSHSCSIIIDEHVDSSGLNSCGIGVMRRVFYFNMANQIIDSCIQYITFRSLDALEESEIVWPLDLDTTDVCNPLLLRPEVLKSKNYSYPYVKINSCRNILFSYSDEIFGASASCYKIQRNWSAIDWCSQLPNRLPHIITYHQIVNVSSTDIPRFEGTCEDIDLCNPNLDCSPMKWKASHRAVTHCGFDSLLNWTIRCDLFNDNVTDIIKFSLDSVFDLPMGTHWIHVTVSNGCGLENSCSYFVKVKSCKLPTVYCRTGIIVNLEAVDKNKDGIPDDEEVVVWAKDLDAGSSQSCGQRLIFSFSKDTSNVKKVLNCDNIGRNDLELWVTDEYGNQSFCKTIVIVDDLNQVPICDQNLAGLTIEGELKTAIGDGVENADVLISGAKKFNTFSDELGEFSFQHIQRDKSYLLRPYKNDDWLNGVSTADIVKIQKHILGIESFQTGALYIAGDVNRSGTITARDISELRKLILGVQSKVEGNTSWRFIDHAYPYLLQNYDPLHDNLPEEVSLTKTGAYSFVPFTGIKVGDLNGNVKANAHFGQVQARTTEPVNIYTEDIILMPGTVNKLSFNLGELNSVLAIQGTLRFNPDLVKGVVAHSNLSEGTGTEFFNLEGVKQGYISFACHTVHPIESFQEVFGLEIEVNQWIKLSDLINLGSDLTNAIAVDENLQEHILRWNATIGNEFEKQASSISSQPNPWAKQTKIYLPIGAGALKSIMVFDAAGRRVYHEYNQFDSKQNYIELNRTKIPSSGVYYYKIYTQHDEYSGKMQVVEDK